MSKFEVVMPEVGDRVHETTITKWLVKEGDRIKEEAPLLKITTGQNEDFTVPSPVNGVITTLDHDEGAQVKVGEVIATVTIKPKDIPGGSVQEAGGISQKRRNYSPLVRNIAKQEDISIEELEKIKGTGPDGKVCKEDVLGYLSNRASTGPSTAPQATATKKGGHKTPQPRKTKDEIIEMDQALVSKQVAPHITSIAEADMTNIVEWRNQIKDTFLQKKGCKLTYLSFFIDAAASALRDYPGLNAYIEENKIIQRKDIHIGIPISLPDGNIAMPVIYHADQRSLLEINKDLNRLVNAAAKDKLSTKDTEGGTFSVSNFGAFRNIMGTPIIQQPQVAILATGMIDKKPTVLETSSGDVIAIRSKMYLSLSYDHRVVNNILGSSFIARVAEYLEDFDNAQKIW